MKLAGIHIDRFGSRTDLNLSGLADGLNVVYGPNGSGKSTVIHFVRWMLYGTRDEISEGYLTSGHTPVRGTIDVQDINGARCLERTNAVGTSGLLMIRGTTQSVQAPTILPNDEFDRCFAVCFDRAPELGDLLNSSVIQGVRATNHHRRRERIQHLTNQLTRYATELSQLAHVPATASELHDRRLGKLNEIDSIRKDYRLHREAFDERKEQAAAGVDEQQSLVNRLRSVVTNIDAAIENRRKILSAEYRQWVVDRDELLERRNRRVTEIDGQVARWRAILEDVRERLEHVRSRMNSIGDPLATPAEVTDMHAFLRTIELRFRDIEHDLPGIYENDLLCDHEADAKYLQGLLGSALDSMQVVVARLCRTVEGQQQSHELHECREEMSCLIRTEKELSDLISALVRQRQQLSRESEVWPSGFDEEVGHLGSDLKTPWPASDDPGFETTLPADLLNAVNDVRLRHLIDRRHAAAAPVHAAELELSNRQRELRDIEQTIARVGVDGRVAALERDIADIDRQLGTLEERTAIERMTSSLEDEVRRLREHWGPSQIVDHARAILRRLTRGEYTEIRIAADLPCQATDRHGNTLEYQLLSRGVQNQVYLSLNLAIIAAFRRRGIEAPLILNDVFGNLDETGAHELVEVLDDMAQEGQQILVFTRHEHIRRMLETPLGRTFTLPGQYEWTSSPSATITPTAFSPQPAETTAEIQPGSSDPTYRWVAEWQRRPESHPLIPATPDPRTEPAALPEDPIDPLKKPIDRDDEPSDALEISLSSGLTEVPTLDADLVDFLGKIHVDNVEALLELAPDEAETRLGTHGITAEIIQRRQREILMLIYLGVTPLEAQLLVACGVPDPERLGRADEAVLLKRIETILDRPQASKRFGSISEYNLARVRNWIDSARRSSYPGRSRRSSSRPSTSSRRVAEHTSVGEDTVRMQSKTDLRFYLDQGNPVVDAPSIGPKSAEKLNDIGIYTVGGLLATAAEKIAVQLDDRRISAETVTQWQLQARLVCCIPNLRGHDAQILVACGIEEPATLSTLDASRFLKQVTEFVASKEGQRIIRNSKKPDLAEVTAWIQWAELARQLKAA